MLQLLIYIFLVAANGPAYSFAICPHNDVDLKRWSSAETWSTGKPTAQSPVVISEPVLLDEQTPDLHSITITASGRLVWSPDVDIVLRVKYIYIYGRMDIGAEDCPFTGPAKIVLRGRRGEFDFKDSFGLPIGDKVIVVDDGGALEIHGKPKLPWTKLTKTVPKLSSETGLLFDHMKSEYAEVQKSENAMVAYIFQIDSGNMVTVKEFGSFELLSASTSKQQKEKDRLSKLLKNLDSGEVLAMGIRKNLYPSGSVGNIDVICDEFETLLFGQVTQTSVMRDIEIYDAYSVVVEKELGGTFAFTEDISKFQLDGDTMLAKSYLLPTSSATKVSVESYTEQLKPASSILNIKVISLDAAYPKLDVLDDASTWQSGDKVFLASTDYDWEQAEEATIVECTDCSSNQIRVDLEVKYTHWGQMVSDRVDERGEVALLTRNIVIEGEIETACVESNGNCDKFPQDTFGGHFKFLLGSTVHIQGAELFHMGQQTDMGRYPLHFHMGLDMRDMEHPPYLKENSIHHCFSRCVTVHGTHGILVKDNVCFDTLGHAYFIEDGGEHDTVFDGNLAANVREGSLLSSDERPTCFWITSPLTTLINNVAAGGEAHGIWYIFPEEPTGPSKGLGFFQPFEADHTPLHEFFNNVIHSQGTTGFLMDNRIKVVDNKPELGGNNKYLPKENPLDPNSADVEVILAMLTEFKNRKNAWLRGGWLHITQSSFADTALTLTFASQREINQNQFLTDSVVVGFSDNLGEPEEGWDRSLPVNDVTLPIIGYSVYDGPEFGENVWFGGFESTSSYTAAAFGFKRNNKFRNSAVNGFRNVKFGFVDGPTTGNRVYDGDLGDPGYSREDGDKTASYRDYDGSVTGRAGYQIVKPWPYYVTPECKYRENWNMAICPYTYGKLQIRYSGNHKGLTYPVMVRDDIPEVYEMINFTNHVDFLVILGGSKTYTLHFTDYIPSVITFNSDGIERGKNVRFGVCLPLDANFDLSSEAPEYLEDITSWTKADSLEELDASFTGSKYYHDPLTGMLYFNFASDLARNIDDSNMCPGSESCPMAKLEILDGDLNDADCRSRLYGTVTPGDNREIDLPLDTADLGPAEQVPQTWGAGPTKPFPNRAAGEDRWTRK